LRNQIVNIIIIIRLIEIIGIFVLDITNPQGNMVHVRENNLELMPHQSAGVEYIRDHKISYLAFDMGFGKTAIALRSLFELNLNSALIIVPGYLRDNWVEEAHKWGFQTNEVQSVIGRKIELQHKRLTICSYDPATIKNILAQSWRYNLLILDEAHNLRGKNAKRTKYITGSDARIKRVAMEFADRTVFLSGTPMLSRPRELWAILRSVFPTDSIMKDYYQYAYTYCAAYEGNFGLDDSGASNLEDLKEKYLSQFMYRLVKEDVLDLPEKVFVDIRFPLNKEVKGLLKVEASLQMDLDALISGEPAIGEYATMRRELGLLKLQNCLEHITDVLENTGAVVVFTYHQELAKRIADHFGTSEIIGSTPNKKRTALVSSFQKEGGVIVGSYGAMGTGFTLTKSSNVVLCELEYSPRLIDQGIDRCHRIGQSSSVTIHTLLWEKGQECELYKQLQKKDLTFQSLF